jgi:transcription elongation factor/antiterminator RfaH
MFENATEMLSRGPANQQSWYAAYTRSRHEKRVAQQLEQKAVESFLPLYATVHRWKDRHARIDVPLFPGYVFVRLQLHERNKVLETPGVVGLLSFQGKPAEIPERDIELLRRALQKRFRAEPHPYLKVGQRIRIRLGPLAGLEGILVHKKPSLRVVLSVDLIMRSISVDIDHTAVQAACWGTAG